MALSPLAQRLSRFPRLDPRAVTAVARAESGLNPRAVGDQGSSFSYFQLHRGGALPAGRDLNWAASPAGIDYALNQIAGVASGLTGRAAVEAIVRRFERPANPGAEITRALGYYGGAQYPTGSLAAPPGANGEPAGGVSDPRREYVAGLLAGQFAANQQTLGGSTSGAGILQQLLVGGKRGLDAGPQPQAQFSAQPGYPLGVRGKVIGLPYQGSHTLYGNWESDNAIDIAAPVGTPVYAIASGVIGPKIGSLGSGDARLQGLRLHLVTPGDEAYYAHLSRIVVKPGQRVKAGQLLGYSGKANGTAHLHISLKHGDPRRLVG